MISEIIDEMIMTAMIDQMVADAKKENKKLARKYRRELDKKFNDLMPASNIDAVIDNLLYEEVTAKELVEHANGDMKNDAKIKAFYARLGLK